MQRMVPVSVTSRTFDHCSSVMSASVAVPPRPALFTNTSMPPRCSSAAATRARTCVLDGDVAGLGERARPGLLGQRVGGLAEPALVGVADQHPRPLLERPAGDRRADAGAGGRGDHHAAVGEQAVGRDVVGCGRHQAGSGQTFGFARQAQRPLADEVALDLVRAAVDRVRPGEQEQALERGELVRRARARRGRRTGRGRPWRGCRARGATCPSSSFEIIASRGSSASVGPESTRSVFQRMMRSPHPGVDQPLAQRPARRAGRSCGPAR